MWTIAKKAVVEFTNGKQSTRKLFCYPRRYPKAVNSPLAEQKLDVPGRVCGEICSKVHCFGALSGRKRMSLVP